MGIVSFMTKRRARGARPNFKRQNPLNPHFYIPARSEHGDAWGITAIRPLYLLLPRGLLARPHVGADEMVG